MYSAKSHILKKKAPTFHLLVALIVSATFTLIEEARAIDKLPVFPGAQGFGTTTVGGRHGVVCLVNSLADSGKGTLRSCLEMNLPRSIVFQVGGTIKLEKEIVIKHPFVSVYGQTAPGDGVLVRVSQDSVTAPLRITTHDVLIQHLRIRAGSSVNPSCCRDSLSIGNSEPNQVYNVVIDHNSISWGVDENADTWYDVNNITFSHNIFSEGLFDNKSNDKGPTSRGLLIGSRDSHSISIHHNLFAHNHQRNPYIAADGIVDITNNLIYHWLSRAAVQDNRYEGLKVNWVKNKFISRTNNHYLKAFKNKLNSATSFKYDILKSKLEDDQVSSIGWGDILITFEEHEPQIYFEGNIGHNRRKKSEPDWKIANTDFNEPYSPELGFHVEQRFPAPEITEVSANSLEDLISPHVGASLPSRDTVDQRIITQLRDKTGLVVDCVTPLGSGTRLECALNAGGWPEMVNAVSETDSDRDGVPDSKEIEFGTNPKVYDSNLDNNKNGYTNLEEWVFNIGS